MLLNFPADCPLEMPAQRHRITSEQEDSQGANLQHPTVLPCAQLQHSLGVVIRSALWGGGVLELSHQPLFLK